MPKRKIKETKPARRMGKKEVLIAPIAMGAATLVALVIIPALAPPPDPTQVCLKAHNVESFQLNPRIEVVVDGQQMLLPDGVGKEPNSKGQDCLRPMHTDGVGNIVHIEYIRPIRFTMADFMRIYAFDNKTITVVNSSSGNNVTEQLTLADYNLEYSYFSELNEFTKVAKPSDIPPFPANNQLVARVELTSK
ncbi:MAG TPA: hypothetical protein VJP79_12490 [Nitrososphaera sp.]|nr:hypothetical protein [Nitrososphaera sp.]